MWTTILQYLLPALLVLATAYLLIDKLLKNEDARRNFELKKQNHPNVINLKLRAYERLMLLLERITPSNMLLNKIQPGMTALELQNVLLNDIRKEFEHNYSQQIYVSAELWQMIIDAQENTLQLIHLCSAQCSPDETASKLATMIIQVYDSKDETAIDAAKEALKNEVNRILG